MKPEQQFNELFEKTKENIETEKVFDYFLTREWPLQIKKEYYEKYLETCLGKKQKPVFFKRTKTDKNGAQTQIDDKTNFESSPSYHKNIILSLAFSKAQKMYEELRNKVQTNSSPDIEEIESAKAKRTDIDEKFIGALSPIEALIISNEFLKGKKTEFEKSIKENDLTLLKEFVKSEELAWKVLNELRGYFSHVFHQPGPLFFTNLYTDTYTPKGKLSTQEWKDAMRWFQERMDMAKDHITKSLNERKEKDKDTLKPTEKETIEKVLKRLDSIKFMNNGMLTGDAALFIACMYLRKSDALYCIKKWTGAKQTEGFFKSLQTFFSYYSVRDSKSVLTLSTPLLKFRKLLGILSTMPLSESESMQPFNNRIISWNDGAMEALEKLEKKIKFEGDLVRKEKLEKRIENVKNDIIPFRRGTNSTYWYLLYIQEQGLLDDFEIAYYKRPEERLQYLYDNGITEKTTEFKNTIKRMEDKAEKRRLRNIFNEAKKNFLFKKPDRNYDNFCIKRRNALFQYTPEGTTRPIQISASPDFLMKWVFTDIRLGKAKAEGIKNRLINYITEYNKSLLTENYSGNLGLKPRIAYPGSIINPLSDEEATALTQKKLSVASLKNVLTDRLQVLNSFLQQNKMQKAPWKFASKRKIDFIFQYIHLSFLKDAYKANKSVDDVRHEALDGMDYLEAFKFIRFYGRHYNTSEFRNFFAAKPVYFTHIADPLKKCVSLEDLFNTLIDKYQQLLKDIEASLTEENKKVTARLLKINLPELLNSEDDKNKKEDDLKKRFAYNVSVPPELINLQSLAGKEKLQQWKSKFGFDEKRFTDFSLIRFLLSENKPFSNTDYLMQQVMPVLFKEKAFPLQNGKQHVGTGVYSQLNILKTEELMLWQIACHYWEQAYVESNTANEGINIARNEKEYFDVPYKSVSPYTKIYQQDLLLELKKEKDETHSGNTYYMTISARKYDDEYQQYETKYLYSYIDWYRNGEGMNKQKPLQYVDEKKRGINAEVKKKIANSLDDIFLLMQAEKYLVEQNYSNIEDILRKQMDDTMLPSFYIPFGGRADDPEKTENREKYAGIQLYHAIKNDLNGIQYQQLAMYRNNALHQQLQNPRYYDTIKKAIIKFCKVKGLLEFVGK